jgi:hypothetical protein
MTTPEPSAAAFMAIASWDELRSALRVHHGDIGPVAVGERFSAVLASKTSAELAEIQLTDDQASAVRKVLEQCRKSFMMRLELIDNVLCRLAWRARESSGQGAVDDLPLERSGPQAACPG